MARRRRTSMFSLAMKSAEVMGAAPHVVRHRLARMAAARFPMAERDRKEFAGMAAEKPLAFFAAWQGLAAGMLEINRAILASFLGGRPFSSLPHKAQLRALDRALNPIHRKVTSNARRLKNTKLR
ncbi:MAG: hypothetical protein ACM3Y9_12750 [Ignavibacteria bacterium]